MKEKKNQTSKSKETRVDRSDLKSKKASWFSMSLLFKGQQMCISGGKKVERRGGAKKEVKKVFFKKKKSRSGGRGRRSKQIGSARPSPPVCAPARRALHYAAPLCTALHCTARIDRRCLLFFSSSGCDSFCRAVMSPSACQSFVRREVPTSSCLSGSPEALKLFSLLFFFSFSLSSPPHSPPLQINTLESRDTPKLFFFFFLTNKIWPKLTTTTW